MKIRKVVVLGVSILLLTACSSEKANTSGVVEEVMQEELLPMSSENQGQASVQESLESEDSSELVKDNDEVIEITEKMYVTYINELYTNPEDYLGKKIKIEGMFAGLYDELAEEPFYVVYRVGPGCCGNDGDMCGIEFTTAQTLPADNEWIEVCGTLAYYEQAGNQYLTLENSTVTVKEERGQEVVYQ